MQSSLLLVSFCDYLQINLEVWQLILNPVWTNQNDSLLLMLKYGAQTYLAYILGKWTSLAKESILALEKNNGYLYIQFPVPKKSW